MLFVSIAVSVAVAILSLWWWLAKNKGTKGKLLPVSVVKQHGIPVELTTGVWRFAPITFKFEANVQWSTLSFVFILSNTEPITISVSKECIEKMNEKHNLNQNVPTFVKISLDLLRNSLKDLLCSIDSCKVYCVVDALETNTNISESMIEHMCSEITFYPHSTKNVLPICKSARKKIEKVVASVKEQDSSLKAYLRQTLQFETPEKSVIFDNLLKFRLEYEISAVENSYVMLLPSDDFLRFHPSADVLKSIHDSAALCSK